MFESILVKLRNNGSTRLMFGIFLYSLFFVLTVALIGSVLEDFWTLPIIPIAVIWYAPLVFYLTPRFCRSLWNSGVAFVRFCVGLYLRWHTGRQQAFELKINRYSLLSTWEQEIRLVAIMPGGPSDPIECALKPISLQSRDKFISYEALSYTWGSAFFGTRNILLNQETCQVRANLYNALIQLRVPDKVRFVWIDALCINQFDLMERSEQVAIMRYIYQISSEVLVWLGESDKTSTQAFEFFELAEDQDDMDSFIQASIGDDEYQSAWKSVRALFKRDYWQRVWIIQEIATAPSVVVQCGSDTARWRTLVRCDTIWRALLRSSISTFPKWFRAVDKEEKGPMRVLSGSHGPSTLDLIRQRFQYDAHNQSQLVDFITGLSDSSKNTIMELIHSNSTGKATNPRDYIYALVGIASDCRNPDFTIDYKLELDEVHQSLVNYFVQKTGRIDIIGYSGVANIFDQGKDLGGWSRTYGSWLPSRASAIQSKLQLSRINSNVRYTADGRSKRASVEFQPAGYLSRKRINFAGVRVGTVYKLGHLLRNHNSSSFTERDLKRVTKDIKQCFDFAKSMVALFEKQNESMSNNVRNNLQEFWRVLVCDRTVEGFTAPDDWEGRFIAIVEDTPMAEYQSFIRPYQDAVLHYMNNRQVFITEDGDFGVGPLSLQTEHEKDKDDILVMLGCNVPMARKKLWVSSSLKRRRSNYTRSPEGDHLLSWVYLQNYMTGKAMEDVANGRKQVETFSLA